MASLLDVPPKQRFQVLIACEKLGIEEAQSWEIDPIPHRAAARVTIARADGAVKRRCLVFDEEVARRAR